jgi:hypothetical protein
MSTLQMPKAHALRERSALIFWSVKNYPFLLLKSANANIFYQKEAISLLHSHDALLILKLNYWLPLSPKGIRMPRLKAK